MTHPDEHQEALLTGVAEAIQRRGLRLPALIVLEAASPLALFAAQLLWLAQPALRPFAASEAAGNLAELLDQPHAVSRLIARLEEEPPSE